MPAAALAKMRPVTVNAMRGARPANTNPIAAHMTEALLPTALRSIATSRAPTPGSSPTSTPSRETAHGHPPGQTSGATERCSAVRRPAISAVTPSTPSHPSPEPRPGRLTSHHYGTAQVTDGQQPRTDSVGGR